MRKIKRIFIHCTAGPQTQTVEEIKKYWKRVRGWDTPGYHYIIKANGEIVNLQPEGKPSNGVTGYNSTSINVCYMGGVDRKGKAVDNRTDAQKASLATLLKDLHSRYPDAEILGHRDVWGPNPKDWKKMCPCFDVKSWWKEVLDEENKQPELPKVEINTEELKPVEPTIHTTDINDAPILAKPVEQPKKGLFSTILSFITKIFK